MHNIVIEIQDISLSRNDNNILDNISFKIERSKALNLYGINGSGKTSLLNIIAGITEPTSGYINNISGDERFHNWYEPKQLSGITEMRTWNYDEVQKVFEIMKEYK